MTLWEDDDPFVLIDMVQQTARPFPFTSRPVEVPSAASSEAFEPFELIEYDTMLDSGIEGLGLLAASGSNSSTPAAGTAGAGLGPAGSAGSAGSAAALSTGSGEDSEASSSGGGAGSKKKKRKRGGGKARTVKPKPLQRSAPEDMPSYDVAMLDTVSLANVRINTQGLSPEKAKKLRKKKHNDVEKARREHEKAVMARLTALVLPYLGEPDKHVKLDILEGAANLIEDLLDTTTSEPDVESTQRRSKRAKRS